jgi:DNA-binding transcriptional regulator GbsR (MarR family)
VSGGVWLSVCASPVEKTIEVPFSGRQGDEKMAALSSFQIELTRQRTHRYRMRALRSSAFEQTVAQATMESAFVSIFADLADVFGNPRSHGAIYGLLFSSERPLSMEEIISRLEISKGCASQGLRHLEELGAIFRKRENGERSHTYMARIELNPLIAGYLCQRLKPRLAASATRLKELERLLPDLPTRLRPIARRRLKRVCNWHRRARAFLPLAQKMLQAD